MTINQDKNGKVWALYVQDSICGTWETLAEAIYPGGKAPLIALGFPITGQTKCEWAEKMGSWMNVKENLSPSFQAFRDGVRSLLSEQSA
jgi:hypothetical protein